MITITSNNNAEQFVNDLNENFAEAAAAQSGGGSGSAISRTVKLQMQGGQLVNGYTGFTTDDSVFKNSIHSVMMMNIEECTITNVATESGETLTIFCYDGSGAYAESVNSISDIDSATCCFVKFMLTNTSGAYTYIRQLSVTVTGKPSFVKNSVPELVAKKQFSFEVTFPSKFDSLSGENGYIGANNNARYYDNGYIKLPPNYSQDGSPVPLVVYIHGSNGFGFDGVMSDPNLAYGPLQNFIVNNGYAVCDCSGLTNADHHKGETGYSEYSGDQGAEDVFFAPSFISCINDLVKHITANYNVKDDGVYIYGKSSAGYTLHMLTQTQGLKIKAAASLAPAITTFANLKHYITHQRTPTCRAFRQLGLSEPTGSWGNENSGDMKLILDNIHVLRQIDPFFIGTDLTDEQVKHLVKKVYGTDPNNNQNGKFYYAVLLNTTGDYYDADSETILDSAVTHVTVPTKIWVADDDTAVSYVDALMYVEMAQRGGSQCYMRRMPSKTGGHHSVDTDGSAPKVYYRPKYSGTAVNIPVAYAELVDWFNRW